MPIYEYECRRCGHRLEEMQRISDPPLKRCPECRGALRKLISAPAFQFKGSGWYVTDYAGKKPADAKGDGGEGKSESKGDAKGDAKSDSKSETKGGSKKSSDGGSSGSSGGGKASKSAAQGPPGAD